MGTKTKLSREDKEKVILTLSEIGVWPSFKSGSNMLCDSICLMTKEKVNDILSILKPNADHFFKDHPCKETVINNYTARCNERLARIEEVKKIKLNKIRGKSAEEVIELLLLPTKEQEKYLQKALDTFWEIYHRVYKEAMEFNSMYQDSPSSEKKYYNFYEEIKRLTAYREKEIDVSLQRMAIFCVHNLWKQHWDECKLMLEADRKRQVPFPDEPPEENWFCTTKSNKRSRLRLEKDFLIIPKCDAIRATILKGSLPSEMEVKSVTISKWDMRWMATVRFKKHKTPA